MKLTHNVMNKATVLLSAVAFLFSCTSDKNGKIDSFDAKEIEKITPLEHSWDKAIPNQEIPEGLTSLSAESCGTCHKEHYEEWKFSTHSHAWEDPQFQAELAKETSPFMCINCHIPLQNQQDSIVKGLINGDIYRPVKEANPHFDKKLQQEGINCASCHVRNGAVIGPTGTTKAPHKTVKDTVHLSEKLCISCHNAVAVVTPQLACTFQTGDEWKAGPYFGKKTCLNCHMPDTTRAIVPGFEPRLSHRHYFPGSGIPKFADQPTKMLNGLSMKEHTPNIENVKVGDTLHFNITLKNEFAGHRVPTGDPERFILVEQAIYTKDSVLFDKKTSRIGEEWEWHPKARKLSDNNLNPKESRTYEFDFIVPNQKGLYYRVRVTKHRSTEENKKYNHLPETYPLSVTIYDSIHPIVLK